MWVQEILYKSIMSKKNIIKNNVRHLITRRDFLAISGVVAACGLGVVAHRLGNRWWEGQPSILAETPFPEPPNPWSTEARYYTSFSSQGSLNCASCHADTGESLPVSYCHIPHTGAYVRCNLCPHGCILTDGKRGICRVRENRGGRLFSMVYGNPCAVHVDPIEKKPFFHFLPSAQAFSLERP